MVKSKNMKISYFTLGCKLNQAETAELQKDLQKHGFLTVPFGKNEDVAIIRACGVTCGASQSTREFIRRAKKHKAIVVATGCLENDDLKEIDFVGKNNQEIIRYLIKKFKPIAKKNNKAVYKTRAMIKIQNGCNFNCAYCVIPSFRGKNIAIPPQKIIQKILDEEKDGRKEIILTGVNICQYDFLVNKKHFNLIDLLKKILKETKIQRIRLSSLDPRLITPALIDLFAREIRLMPHWHLSLQSGSDTVLKRMNRGYNTKKYLDLVKKIRQRIPLFSVTTDIIVGFPGETETEFNETCKFVKTVEFSKVHIFPYSRRPSTAAADMLSQVQDKIKTERVKQLRKISEETSQKFKKRFIGKTRAVLFEEKKNGAHSGYTPEYIQIKSDSRRNLKNKIITIKLTGKKLGVN